MLLSCCLMVIQYHGSGHLCCSFMLLSSIGCDINFGNLCLHQFFKNGNSLFHRYTTLNIHFIHLIMVSSNGLFGNIYDLIPLFHICFFLYLLPYLCLCNLNLYFFLYPFSQEFFHNQCCCPAVLWLPNIMALVICAALLCFCPLLVVIFIWGTCVYINSLKMETHSSTGTLL